MAFTTELVLPAGGGFETVTQTISTNSGSVWLPAGVWLCTLTAKVRISSSLPRSITLGGVKAECSSVKDAGTTSSADLGVVLPSVTGGTSLDVGSSGASGLAGSLTFWAARIG